MNTNIYWDSQICISVPLILKMKWPFLITFAFKKNSLTEATTDGDKHGDNVW